MSSAGRDDLVAGDFEVEQHTSCSRSVQTRSMEHLHRGRSPPGQNLGGGLGLIKRLARWRYSDRRSRSTWMRSGDDGRRRAVEVKPGRPDQRDERLWAAPSTSTAGSAGGARGSVPTPPAIRAVAPASPLAKAASSASSGASYVAARVRPPEHIEQAPAGRRPETESRFQAGRCP